MDTSDALSNLLQDPNAMQKISELAAGLMGSSPTSDKQAPAAPSVPAPESALLQQALPAITAIASTGKHPAGPRAKLLTALKPFLSSNTGAQIDRAEHLLSVVHMTQAAAGQLLSQSAAKGR